MKYFEDNPEIFAALVAAIAILGGLLGSVIGAKIQANGGRAQAAAAQKAAEIAAEAQRVAALWTVRHMLTAEFIQLVRAKAEAMLRLYSEDDADRTVQEQINERGRAVRRKAAEIELIVPSFVMRDVENMITALDRCAETSNIAGPARYFRVVLGEAMWCDDSAHAELAGRARASLDELGVVAASGDDEEKVRAMTAAQESLRSAITDITDHQVQMVVAFEMGRGWHNRQRQDETRVTECLDMLVTAAREMLKSEDDVAPTVPPQRPWWRRNSAETPAVSA
ncbi:hypothetical protein ACFVDH_24480 [Streptomyces sp. NPDC057674]|uniref:hypothetical protein n=1 Tax=Streptomyces sp. NPDC057674 TaxID=3346203 RepID=UPI00367B2316